MSIALSEPIMQTPAPTDAKREDGDAGRALAVFATSAIDNGPSERDGIGMPRSLGVAAGAAPSWWRGPLLVSLLLHVTIAVAMIVDWRFAAAPSDAPPPASMVVELAVMPAAPPVPPSDVAPGPQQQESAPKPVPQDNTKFDPPPQVDPALNPAFALPVKQEAKPVDTPQVAAVAHQTTAPPATEAPKLDKAEAPMEGNNAAPPSDAEQAWEGRIAARLARNKRYPAASQHAGEQDTVFLRLVMDRQGRLIEGAVKKSRGFAALDAETLDLARRAGPYPAPPDSVKGDRIVRIFAIEFYIGKHR